MSAWVLLRHELPDGSWHHDWMFEQATSGVASDAPAGCGLLTFKLEPSVGWPPNGAFEAERLADHRLTYLQYEGPIAGGRGAVQQVAAGECRIEASAEMVRIWLEGKFVVGRPKASGAAARRWRFHVHEGDLEESARSGILE